MGFLGEQLKAASGRPAMVASSFMTAIFNTVALLLIARNMGPEILGTLGFLLAFVGLFFFVGDMGNGLAFERVLAKGYKFSDCYRAFIMAKVKLTVTMTIIAGLMIALYIYILAPMKAATHTPLHPVSMILMLGYFITANLAAIWIVGISAKSGRARPRTYDLVESLAKVVMVAGLLSIMDVSGDQDAIFQLTLIYLLAGTLGMMLVRNNARRLKTGEDNEEIEVEFQDTAVKLVPFIALSAILVNMDKVALWFFSDFETLGIYFGAQRITIFIAASAVSIEILLGEALTGYIKDSNTQSISDTLRMTERYVSLTVLPVACFYILFSDGLLNSFLGEHFAGAGVTVALLAGAGLFTALASPHISYLLKAGHTRELAISSGLAFITFCVLAIMLLSNFVLQDMNINDMDGTAIAVLAAAVVGFAVTRLITWRMLDCRPHPKILAHILSAGLMLAFIEFVIWYFNIAIGFGWLIILAALGFFIYVIGLYLTGEMLKRDYQEFLRLTKAN
jgi:O-antigen/teichoic acid export membrane protein